MFKDNGEGEDNINGPKQRLMCRLGPRYILSFFSSYFLCTN